MQLGFIFSFVGAVAVAMMPHAALAQGFVPLVMLPGIVFTDPVSLVNGFIRLTIVAAALLAVVRIIYGGFIYLTTEAISSKGDAKGIISDALSGLVLILVSILILQIINPDILNVRFFTNLSQNPNNPTLQEPTRQQFIEQAAQNIPPAEYPPLPSNTSELRLDAKDLDAYFNGDAQLVERVDNFTAQCKESGSVKMGPTRSGGVATGMAWQCIKEK